MALALILKTPSPIPALTLPVRPTMATDLNYSLFNSTPTFIDDFDGGTPGATPSLLDRTKWITRLPYGGLTNNTLGGSGRGLPQNGELEYYGDAQDAAVTPGMDPFSFGPSVLRITASPSANLSNTNGTRGQPWLSGEISTSGIFEQYQGLFEICCRLTRLKGYWPAFWMLQQNPIIYPPELDPLEYFAFNGVSEGGPSTFHSAVASPFSGAWINVAPVLVGESYNVISWAWTADQFVTYFNGREVQRLNINPAALPGGTHGLYVIANLAVGGDYPEASQNAWPRAAAHGTSDCYDIDYIRVLQWAGSPPTAPSFTLTAHSASNGGLLVWQRDGGSFTNPVTLTTTPTDYIIQTTGQWATIKFQNNFGDGTITLDSLVHTDGSSFTTRSIGGGASTTYTHP